MSLFINKYLLMSFLSDVKLFNRIYINHQVEGGSGRTSSITASKGRGAR